MTARNPSPRSAVRPKPLDGGLVIARKLIESVARACPNRGVAYLLRLGQALRRFTGKTQVVSKIGGLLRKPLIVQPKGAKLVGQDRISVGDIEPPVCPLRGRAQDALLDGHESRVDRIGKPSAFLRSLHAVASPQPHQDQGQARCSRPHGFIHSIPLEYRRGSNRPLQARANRARPGLGAALLGLMLVAGCNDEGPDHSPPKGPLVHPRATSAPLPLPTNRLQQRLTEEVEKELAQASAQGRPLTPRPKPPNDLAFVGNRLAMVTDTDLVVHQIIEAGGAYRAKVRRWPVPDPVHLVALGDGTLVALGKEQTSIIYPDRRPPKKEGRLVLFPDSVLSAEPGRSCGFQVWAPSDGTLQRYRIDRPPSVSGIWLPETTLTVPELRGAVCAMASNGAWLCVLDGELVRYFPHGRPTNLGSLGPGSPITRVLPTARADRVFVVREDGRAHELRLGPPLRILSHLDLPYLPFEVAKGSSTLLELRVARQPSQSAHFSLMVLSEQGEPLFELGLLPDPAAAPGQDRATQSFGYRSIAAHPQKPWIAWREGKSLRALDWRKRLPLVPGAQGSG